MAKENNVVTEQTFTISFYRTDSVPLGSGYAIARDGQDYRIAEAFLLDFFPSEQRINQHLVLMADTVLEATEAFQISLSTQRLPSFYSADMLFSRAFVVIEDDDSKSKLNFDVVAS